MFFCNRAFIIKFLKKFYLYYFSEQSQKGFLEITTSLEHYRIKIVEVIQSDDGMFVYAIPYKDRKLTKTEELISI